MPGQITLVNQGTFEVMPVEIAGWWVRQQGLGDGDWLLVTSHDKKAILAAHLAIRLRMNVNVVNGVVNLTNSQVFLHLLAALPSSRAPPVL